MRRDLTAAALVALTLLATVPAFDRVFEDAAWRPPALAAAGLALAVAVLIRRVGAGPFVSGALSALGLLVTAPWLTGIEDRPSVPDRATLAALWELLGVGLFELRDTAAPAPALTGLLLLVVIAWWLVAHLAHESSVRWRRPGLSLIALTVLWAIPLAVPLPGHSGWVVTVPYFAAAGLTLLLTAGHVGHVGHVGEPGGDEAVGVAPSGVLVGAFALLVAVSLPGILPGYAQPAWVPLGASDAPRGYQPIVDISQRLGLPEERDVLRVRTSKRTYLRLAGLESFDGDVWRLGPAAGGSYRPDASTLFPASGALPPEEPAAVTEAIQVDIEVLELANIYVPVPYQPVEILGPIRDEMIWSTDGGFLATWDVVEAGVDGRPRVGVREGLEYRVQAARPAPTFEQLQEVGFDDPRVATYTQLPRDYPELGAQAESVYADAGATTVVEQALALQDWFVGPDGGFTYDLGVPALRGENALTEFVLEDRVGYCEYFATAMAVMLRQTGIPARVATGFLPGRVTMEADPAAGRDLTEYTVSTADAHAWVEVLFPGAGWVTFEPTPRSDESQAVPTPDDLTPNESLAQRRERELEAAGEDPDFEQSDPGSVPDLFEEEDPAGLLLGDGAQGSTDPDGPGGARPLLGAALAVAAVATFVVSRRRRIRDRRELREPNQRVLDAQRRLLTTAARHGVPRAEHETTIEVIERWRAEHRIDDRGVPVAVGAQAAAFGGRVGVDDAEEIERLVAELEQMLRDSVSSRQRALAPVRLPSEAALRAVRRARDAFARWRDGR